MNPVHFGHLAFKVVLQEKKKKAYENNKKYPRTICHRASVHAYSILNGLVIGASQSLFYASPTVHTRSVN